MYISQFQFQRVSSDVAKYIERPISQLHHGIADGPSLDFLSGDSPTIEMLPLGYTITDLEKSSMVDIACSAMDELIMLMQRDAPFWMNSSSDGRKVLNLEAYENSFPGAIKSPHVRMESSKDSSFPGAIKSPHIAWHWLKFLWMQ